MPTPPPSIEELFNMEAFHTLKERALELERENAELTEMLLAATMYPAEQRDGLVWHGFTPEFDARASQWRAKLRAKN
jgi:hypothetical protein